MLGTCWGGPSMTPRLPCAWLASATSYKPLYSSCVTSTFMRSAAASKPQVAFDTGFATNRRCSACSLLCSACLPLLGQHSQLTVNTAMLSKMAPCGMLQDAVVLALSFDMSLASATANRPEDEPALKRSLWLTIARHIVHQHPSQDQVSCSSTCTTCASYLLHS